MIRQKIWIKRRNGKLGEEMWISLIKCNDFYQVPLIIRNLSEFYYSKYSIFFYVFPRHSNFYTTQKTLTLLELAASAQISDISLIKIRK